MVCEKDVPPERITDEVRYLCNVETDLEVVRKRFEKRWKGLRRFCVARYSLELQVGGAGMEFDAVQLLCTNN